MRYPLPSVQLARMLHGVVLLVNGRPAVRIRSPAPGQKGNHPLCTRARGPVRGPNDTDPGYAPSQDTISAAGPLFTFPEVSMVPRPRTRPHPPRVVACTSAATGRRPRAAHAARNAHQRRRQARSDYPLCGRGRPAPVPARHIGAVAADVAGTRAEARRMLRTQLPRWIGPGLAGYRPADGRPRPARDPASPHSPVTI